MHPLIDRLTSELGYPRFETLEACAAWASRPGLHVVFVPGDPKRNLESADVAVILPELHAAFQRRFDCAVAGDAMEEALRKETVVFKTPSLIVFRDGRMVGGIPKVRDWDDYVARLSHLTSTPVAAE
ncbi:hydrogenase accessory protein [Jannaschia seohaensis]|uniref:Hydrogenase-1 operon protein HyaE n=1 Tax=Jannaschia seohaensis TaxID=475081 RepID=A0A2Y9A2M8_9RHOB|nr:hydrogenase accessory protein [Jannaschia seohaensis]PWJ21848.1 hydrogenase-1 operon protein HyaE [Jannaschia seohaensis]SSA38126.1 hydrogenase-1 operon protein HyaE [Jannaschia seohaensis]